MSSDPAKHAETVRELLIYADSCGDEDVLRDGNELAAYLDSLPGDGGKALDICRRLVEWDRKYPKGMLHPMQGEYDFDELMREAAALTPATGGE